MAWVIGKKILATARAVVLRLDDRRRPAPRDERPFLSPLVSAQLSTLRAGRFVGGDRTRRHFLLDHLRGQRVGNFDGPRLHGVQPTEGIAIVDLAQFFFRQLAAQQRNPILQF
jgi:hypothetical protein